MIDVAADLELFEVSHGKKIQLKVLKQLLPDIETTLFFGKVYKLDARRLSELLRALWNTPLVSALLSEGGQHSVDLQSYVYDVAPPEVRAQLGSKQAGDPIPQAELLPLLWDNAMLTVAQSIQEVADKVAGTLGQLPTTTGKMLFQQMAKMNRLRPTVGRFEAVIQHHHTAPALVVLDVSGSMSETTVRTIVSDVVALAYQANAYMAIVSNNAYLWEPGSFTVADVLNAAEYGGTYYESLVPVFARDWSAVVTIADYDSSYGAKGALANAGGTIGTVFDMSLVDRPTYLAECVGQLAQEVKPLLVAAHNLTGW